MQRWISKNIYFKVFISLLELKPNQIHLQGVIQVKNKPLIQLQGDSSGRYWTGILQNFMWSCVYAIWLYNKTSQYSNSIYRVHTTLNMIFSVTYYLKLHNTKVVYISFFTKKYQIGCLDNIEH